MSTYSFIHWSNNLEKKTSILLERIYATRCPTSIKAFHLDFHYIFSILQDDLIYPILAF